MQYFEVTLEEVLDEIFRIGKESFNEFYPIDKFLKRLQNKKYWVYVAKENEIVGFKIFYEDEEGQIYDWLDGVSPQYTADQQSLSEVLFVCCLVNQPKD